MIRGSTLAVARTIYNIGSQQDLAIQLRVDRQTVYRLEKKDYIPTRYVEKCEQLGYNLTEIQDAIDRWRRRQREIRTLKGR